MKWLFRITWLYLLIPIILFCMGWLRLIIAIPVVALLLWILWKLWRDAGENPSPLQLGKGVFGAALLAGLWVFLSGVGGTAFQNWDHHWRNAVLRDLITYDWPVVYSSPEKGPIRMLVYYVGYWLPAALAGKLLGWKFANFFLFLWTWLGVLFTALHLNIKLKASLPKSMLLLVFFSGMDALGSLFLAGEYPGLWPPVQHLEIWAGDLQYSSFTTQLFWVFNQAVPAWLCTVLIVNGLKRDQAAFVWALCFFFAPLASIGLSLYLLIDWFVETRKTIKNPFNGLHFDVLIAGILIVLVSYLFFSSNTAAQERGVQPLIIRDAIVFFLLEGGVLWLLLAARMRRDPRWLVTGLLLIFIPFIQFGSGRDFVMRASIPPLFYLMAWCGEAVFRQTTSRFVRIAIIALVILGALTPLYEIDRSVYRTFEYYFASDENQLIAHPPQPVTHLEPGVAPEAEHPGVLVADDIQTLKFMNDKLSRNFIANVRQSLYYRYAAPP